ncbi:MAG: c-type cytochrome [Pseudomonadota bacterium]
MKFAVLVITLMFAHTTLADGEAEAKYREGVMKAIGGHMSSMGAILRGRVHSDEFGLHANAMADLAKVAPGVFPAGSGGPKTEALPAIWEKPAEFSAAMDKFVSAANGIADAANNGGQIGPAMQALGQSCKGCHDNFRAEN